MHTFGQSGPLDQVRGMLTRFGFMHFVSEDLATVDAQDQVEIEPSPGGPGYFAGT